MKRLISLSVVVLIGFAFVIPISSSWSAGTLKVATPNGKQSWTTGKKYLIKWKRGNAGKFVKIQLYKSGKHYRWIKKRTKNDGKHVWKIPSAIKAGKTYKIKITSRTDKTVTDTSNKNFTIKKPPKLKVIWPKGGECLEVDRYYTFRWNRSGISGGTFPRVDIEFVNGRWITANTSNDGRFKWRVSSIDCCGKYYVEIYNAYETAYPKEYARSKGKVTISENCD
jgi:hypothetical protein